MKLLGSGQLIEIHSTEAAQPEEGIISSEVKTKVIPCPILEVIIPGELFPV